MNPRWGRGRLVSGPHAPKMSAMSPSELPALESGDPEEIGFSRARLRWLVKLRWVAMSGVFLAGLTTLFGVVEGPSAPVLFGVANVGVLANLWLDRSARRGPVPSRAAPPAHAALDLALLTPVRWALGGVETPFFGFYLFRVVLMATRGGPRATVLTALLALGFAVLLAVLDASPYTRSATWNPSP